MKSISQERYGEDPWNMYDHAVILASFMNIALRIIGIGIDMSDLSALHIIILVAFYLRILQLYYIHPRLGPQVIVFCGMVCVTIDLQSTPAVLEVTGQEGAAPT